MNFIKDEEAGSSVESAFGISAILVVVMYVVLTIVAFLNHLTCVDIGRELVRLESVKSENIAKNNLVNSLPKGSNYSISKEDKYVIVKVEYKPIWLFGLNFGAESIGIAESELFE